MAKKLDVLVGTSSPALATARMLNIKAAATYLATTVWFMRSLIWERTIPFAKLGNRYVFDRADLDAFAVAQKVSAR